MSSGRLVSFGRGFDINALRRVARRRTFWITQILLATAFLIHLGADLLYHADAVSVPGFVSLLVFFLPVIYSSSVFGMAGSIVIAAESIALVVPQELIFAHSGTKMWAVSGVVASLVAVAVISGERFGIERSNQRDLRDQERSRTEAYYRQHPLFGVHLLSMIPDGVVIADEDGTICYVNEAFEKLSGYASDELVGKEVEILIPPERRSSHLVQRLLFARDPKPRSIGSGLQLDLFSAQGSNVAVVISLVPYVFGGKNWVLLIVCDDSVRRLSEEARAEAERLFHLAFANNVSGMVVTDLEHKALAVNHALSKMLGRTSDEIIGHDFSEITFPKGQSRTIEASERMLGQGNSQEVFTKRYQHRDGHLVWAEVSQSLVQDDSGRPLYFINSIRDITEERALLAQLSHQAMFDQLTGLANRTLFEDSLSQALSRVSRNESWLSVFLIDLDDFKDVNDTFGHHVGDSLLRAVAKRLKRATAVGDTLSRFGGDEFLYLGEAVSGPEDAEAIAQRLLRVFASAFLVDGEKLIQSASIGFSASRGGRNSAELIRDADIALYEAKRQGTGRYCSFRAEMRDRASSRIGMVQELRQSIASGGLSMHYQPIVDLGSGAVVGVEALMRWFHPDHGPVSPEVFIPLAEQSELIFDLGSFALRSAVNQAATWDNEYGDVRHPYVAVNLSPRQFHDPKLLRKVQKVLEDNDFSPERLVLEITEGAAFADIEAATRIAGELRRLGVVLAIDDFGTGYSSLSYFTLLRPRMLKVDQSFIRNAHQEQHGARLLEAIKTIGESLDAVVVAEGIEMADQIEMLRRAGYRYGQGYLFSPPVPDVDFSKVSGYSA